MRCVLWFAILFTLGCMPKVPPQRLPERTPIAVTIVVDAASPGGPDEVPEALRRAFREVLDQRNLQMHEVPASSLGGQKLTDLRLKALQQQAAGAPLQLLVELTVRFFSQLDGRYRWEVGCALTAARTDGVTAKDAVEVPVVLMYDRERETAAISTAASDLAGRLGPLLDGLLIQQNAPTATSTHPVAIYFAMVDRFANGTPRNDADSDVDDPQAFHGGDLAGLTARLDWLQRLGIDTLWLSPIFSMRQTKWHGYGAFHGYWTDRLDTIEPRFGKDKSLSTLKAGLERRGMSLLLDVVVNHVGPGTSLQLEHPDWFHNLGGLTDYNDPQQLVERDVQGLPDFDQEQPHVFKYLVTSTRRWLRDGEAAGLSPRRRETRAATDLGEVERSLA